MRCFSACSTCLPDSFLVTTNRGQEIRRTRRPVLSALQERGLSDTLCPRPCSVSHGCVFRLGEHFMTPTPMTEQDSVLDTCWMQCPAWGSRGARVMWGPWQCEQVVPRWGPYSSLLWGCITYRVQEVGNVPGMSGGHGLSRDGYRVWCHQRPLRYLHCTCSPDEACCPAAQHPGPATPLCFGCVPSA